MAPVRIGGLVWNCPSCLGGRRKLLAPLDPRVTLDGASSPGGPAAFPAPPCCAVCGAPVTAVLGHVPFYGSVGPFAAAPGRTGMAAPGPIGAAAAVLALPAPGGAAGAN